MRFPEVHRHVIANGLQVWCVAQPGVPAVSATLLIDGGSAQDPGGRPGLASLVADLMDEGAGGRDAIALADALSRLGARLEVDVGADMTAISATTLSRFLIPVLGIVADIVARPHLTEPDLMRVRDLRVSRLRQLSRSPAAVADRAFLQAVFGGHPYGRGGLGTTRSLLAMTLDEARAFWTANFGPARATLLLAGDVTPAAAMSAANAAFASWASDAPRPLPLPAPTDADLAAAGGLPNDSHAPARALLIERPGAPQSEVRVGHLGPPRLVSAYHALITLNAMLGGMFTSRINRNLRETRAITYGARTSFDMRRAGGTFSGDTSVQGDATAVAVREILAEIRGIQADAAVGRDELDAARASLTRGYVRNFEAAGHLTRAMAQLVTHGLDDATFDRFVPEVEALSAADIEAAARQFLHPDDAVVVVAGDPQHAAALIEIGREVVTVTPEF